MFNLMNPRRPRGFTLCVFLRNIERKLFCWSGYVCLVCVCDICVCVCVCARVRVCTCVYVRTRVRVCVSSILISRRTFSVNSLTFSNVRK